MDNILDYSLVEMQDILAQYNQPKFRAKQLFECVYNYKNVNEITNISKTLLDKIQNDYNLLPLEIDKKFVSKDGTMKFLYKLHDGKIIEGVLMSYKYGNTICVSTQVGCRMGCKFCASTKNGLIRNLSAGEILAQVLCVNKFLGGTYKDRKITNIVLMGSGEPLDNYDNVMKFLSLVSSENGINISQRNISLSTCGLVPKIDEMAALNLQITLTISLHATTDEERRQTMPIANKYSISQIIDAAKRYFEKTKRRIVFEYTLISGVNDSLEHAKRLANLMKGLCCHINLIPLNEIEGQTLKSVSKKNAYAFMDKLNSLNTSATVRRTMGDDIAGACGQLKAKFSKED